MSRKKSNNQLYWEKRFLQIKAREIRSTEEFEKALQPQLGVLEKELQSEIEKFTVRYANNQGVDKDEARKLLKDVKSKNWRMTLEQFAARAKAGEFPELLDAEYLRSRVARLQELESQLKILTASFSDNQTDQMEQQLVHQYIDTYTRTSYASQSMMQNFAVIYAVFDEQLLRAVVSRPWEGSNFSQHVWGTYRNTMVDEVMDVIVRGTLMGYGPAKVTSMFRAKFGDIKRYDVHRLIVTEMAHVAEEATFKSYEDNEIDWYEYSATLESHTCDVCAALDGQHFKVIDKVEGKNAPVMHPHCRCTTMPWLEGLPPVLLRGYRDPDSGRWKTGPNMSFKEWKKKYVV
ncbi:minor capsid protein [Secundilactobacillus kimchicus]|uniref:Phage head morphogenesis domain-containing protein n=1 Tax=Secundilactobacillus kimchicus JCM 15530 TaxID=1302272 RepID=A0A0R1HU39_9LACO|nr:minor capsid protein [Secundilactobacillus kimchicus]KRK49033.1 hypothetical protein FC96_GL001361 [Secundilactobacillus kimchicus JCM 15530]